MTTSPLPIACTLTPDARGDREALIARINRRWLRGHEQQRFTLTLTYDRAAAESVHELVRLERRCCAFLRFDVREGDDAIVLRIDAPADTDSDVLLAPFVAMGANGADGRVAAVAAGTSAAAALACGVCCVVPVAFPGIAMTALGAGVAAFSHAYRWALVAALLLVLVGWAGVALHGVRSRRAPNGATIRAMLLATVLFALASSWPALEPHLTALMHR